MHINIEELRKFMKEQGWKLREHDGIYFSYTKGNYEIKEMNMEEITG